MNKLEYIKKHPEPIAYFSGFGGFEIHGIEYGIEDYIIGVSGAWGAPRNRKYHRLKIYHDNSYAYFKLYGYKCRLSDCVRLRGCVL